MATSQTMFPQFESSNAARQPKTDRLILARMLRDKAADKRIEEADQRAAHKILVHWADLETKGKLAQLNEEQLQGDFLSQVFGEALEYAALVDGVDKYQRIQHHHLDTDVPDAILGSFKATDGKDQHQPLAVVELKGPAVHIDKDRSNGRNAVDQCWHYLVNTPPTCRWGIVSNIVSFRLYERDSTKRAYEHFSLQELRDFETFRQFYCLFHRQGLIEAKHDKLPRAELLVKDSKNRQREVGDELYRNYSERRLELIRDLHHQHGHSVDMAVEMAQRLLDRIIFIAFCEDRGLLPAETIPKAYSVAGFHAVTNPRWQQFKTLFRFVDEGSAANNIPRYNGGLFKTHPVDELDLPDQPWTGFFHGISKYDFADEVNLDVLGHLFERSITELEKLKETGLFGDAEKAEQYAQMPQSAKRKAMGIYYTPPELTSRIVQYTVDELIDERFADAAIDLGVPEAAARRGELPADEGPYWQRCFEILRSLKIVDPACGSGAFLFQAYNTLELRYHEVIGHLKDVGCAEPSGESHHNAANDGDHTPVRLPSVGAPYEQIPQFILQDNLYGVDLSPEAVEITQLALWIRSAAPGQTLATLSENIVHGNSLVHDKTVHPAGFVWEERFPEVFDRDESGFDCVIGNPPWERIKLQEREFFSLPAPEIATASNAAKRRKLVAKLEEGDPELFARYEEAKEGAADVLTYCRKSGEYPLTGRGDINTHAVFAELSYQIVAPSGRVGLLVPSGIATDKTTNEFFAAVAATGRLIRLYDFENKRVFFPEVHPSYRFCILNFYGSDGMAETADYVFFVHKIEELEDRSRHVSLSGDDIKLLNPNTCTCPIFPVRREAEITKAIYRRVPVLIDHNREGPTGNPWRLDFLRMFDQTNDAELFQEPDELLGKKLTLYRNEWRDGQECYLPVYEAKMFRPYDHRFGTVFEDTSNWINQGQTIETNLVQHQNPEHVVQPRWWVKQSLVADALSDRGNPTVIGFRDVTRATDTRTFLAAALPSVGFTNKVPLLLTSKSMPLELCLLANVNSIPLDYCTKQKFGGISLNFFIVEQLPVLSPDTYSKPCPWESRTTLESWISERVLKLSCTAEDMLPLAEACDFTSGSFQEEYQGRLNKWDPAERAVLTAELDAAYFHLYGIDRDDAEYILSTFKGIDDPQQGIPGHPTQAQLILQKFAEYSFPGS